MGFFLMGSYVAYYADIGDIDFLRNLMPVDEYTFFCSLDTSDSLEYVPDLIFHCHCPFCFFRTLHKVPVLLGFTSLSANDRIPFFWLDC